MSSLGGEKISEMLGMSPWLSTGMRIESWIECAPVTVGSTFSSQ